MTSPKYILNEADSSANILINGEIDDYWGVGLRQMADEISASGAKKIMIQINSVHRLFFHGKVKHPQQE